MFIRGLRNLPFSTVVVLVTFSTIGFVEHQKFIKTWVRQTVPVPDFSRFGLFDIFTEENNYDEEVDLSENDSSENSSEKDEAPAEIITDPKFWEENDRKIEERFRKRKLRLEAYCKEKEINDMREWKTRNRHFYVGDAEHKLLGCVPLKAGCTSWIYWQTSQKYPNSESHSMGAALRSVGAIGPSVGQQLIAGDDATRFLVVRHPLFRFYSGFRQKFKKADPLHFKLLKKSGYLRERNQAHEQSTDDDMTITFADFGHFIGSMIPKSSTFNSHFRPQFHACQACNYKYDNIIKTEFMNEEANYVLRKAGYDIKPWEGFVQRGSTLGGISKEIRSDKLKEQLSTLSREDLTGLVKRYEMDLEAFGYTVDIENNLLGGWDD